MKKGLIIFLLLFVLLLTSHFSLPTPILSQPQSCSADKPYEIIPSCVVCGDVLFCFGNNYRLCETDPRIPAPAPGARNGSWYYDAASFPDGTITYNGVTFSVPEGGVHVCDSNVYGCNNALCKSDEGPGPGWQLPDCGKGPIGDTIDLLEYFFPPDQPTNNISSGEVFKTVPDGGEGFIIYKSTDTSYYESFRFNGNYIYHLEDTTWATEAGDVHCLDTGNPAYFTLVDGKYDDPCRAHQEIKAGIIQEGMKWVKRFTKVCEQVSYPGTVIGVDKNTHQCCQAPFTGPMDHGMRLDYQGCIVFPTGVVSEDAVMLTITGGAGAGEHFYYDHNRGWVGFDRGNPAAGNFITDPISTTPPGEDCLYLEKYGTGPVDLDTSPSLVCGKTTYTANKTTEEPVATPTPEEGEGEASVLGLFNLFGEVKLPKAEFPDYSLFEPVARNALTALLPAYWQDSDNPGSLNIPQGSLPIKIKHRIEGQNPEDKQDPNKTVTDSETDATFVPFLAENYALSAVFNPKSESTNSLNYVLAEVEPGIPPEGNECAEGGETKNEDLTLNDPNPGFSANILEEIINIIGNIIRKILKTEVKVESRGNVYGGEKLIEKSDAVGSLVPEYFLPDEDASSHQEGTYSVSTNIFGSQEKNETLKYQGQKAVHDRYCQMLCSVYPAKFKPKDCECE